MENLSNIDGYKKLLQILVHEYFHQWNIRRLRPKELIEYNYSKPVITENLWFAEGVTSYIELLIPKFAGITTEEDLLKELSDDIGYVISTPGRFHQSISESSEESWIKFYNRTIARSTIEINYYKFGRVLAFCLDIKLRESGTSLIELIRVLWDKYGKIFLGYSRSEIKKEIYELTNKDANYLDYFLDFKDSLPIDSSLQAIGLLLVQSKSYKIKTGLELNTNNGTVLVKQVHTNSPGSYSGIIVNDEILSINNFRIRNLDDFNNTLVVNKKNEIILSRLGNIRNTELLPEESLEEKWSIQKKKVVSSDIESFREKWIKLI